MNKDKWVSLSGEVSISLQLPEYWVIFITSFCFLVFSLTLLQDIILDLRKLSGK